MINRRAIRIGSRALHLSAPVVYLLLCVGAFPQSASSPSAPFAPVTNGAILLDHVVAVVNNNVILASDIALELRIGVLDPNQVGDHQPSAVHALERLISRTLIEQQISEQGGLDQTDAQKATAVRELAARIHEVRSQLPACVRQNCLTDSGWNAFLTQHGLTASVVESYLRDQIEVLGFIEQRFRQGIRISDPQIESFYKKTLLPQYPEQDKAPTLESVAPRVQEVLLEEQVNVLLDEWLKTLRKQGDVEILDPALDIPSAPPAIPVPGSAAPVPTAPAAAAVAPTEHSQQPAPTPTPTGEKQ